MRRGREIWLVVLLLVSHCLSAQNNEAAQFKYSIALIQGQWHVVASNFPTWLKGDKKEPGNLYSNFRTRGHTLKFDDLITYTQGGESKTIRGKLKQKKSDRLNFVWRGKGLLFIFKSKWQIVASDSEGQWLVLYSPGTLTSPEGMDIISRRRRMSEHEVKAILAHVDKKYIKKPLQALK